MIQFRYILIPDLMCLLVCNENCVKDKSSFNAFVLDTSGSIAYGYAYSETRMGLIEVILRYTYKTCRCNFFVFQK